MEVIAYKALPSDMVHDRFQFEIGKTYKEEDIEHNKVVFYAYLEPNILLTSYYKYNKYTRYFKVKLSGIVSKCNDYLSFSVSGTEITILEEITDNINEIIETTEWWRNEGVLDLLYYIEDFAVIQRNDGYMNFINKDGGILSNEWFLWAWDFHEGFARVENGENSWNYVNKQGKLLSDSWFDNAGEFCCGFAVVERADHLYNFIDKNGNFLSNKWFDWVDRFNEGFARIGEQIGDLRLFNFIDEQCNTLSNEWFEWCGEFSNGFGAVKRKKDHLFNFIDKDGNYLSNEWFMDVINFEGDYAEIKRINGNWYKLDKHGNIND